MSESYKDLTLQSHINSTKADYLGFISAAFSGRRTSPTNRSFIHSIFRAVNSELASSMAAGMSFEGSCLLPLISQVIKTVPPRLMPPTAPKRAQTTLVKGGTELHHPMHLHQMVRHPWITLAPSHLEMYTSDYLCVQLVHLDGLILQEKVNSSLRTDQPGS